jgi:hypothetical protein
MQSLHAACPVRTPSHWHQPPTHWVSSCLLVPTLSRLQQGGHCHMRQPHLCAQPAQPGQQGRMRLLPHSLRLQLLNTTDATWAQKHPDMSDPYITDYTPQTTRVKQMHSFTTRHRHLLLHWMTLHHNKRAASYNIQPLPISLLQQHLSCLCRAPHNQAHPNSKPPRTHTTPRQQIPSYYTSIARR